MTPSAPERPFPARGRLQAGGRAFAFHSLRDLVGERRVPFSIQLVLESLARHCDGRLVREEDVRRLAGWRADARDAGEVPFMPARVILQDFTGVPCVVDLAAMREAVRRLGGDPESINPLVPVDLVIDHSVQVDVYGTSLALFKNAEYEFKRNRERYEFLRWGQAAFRNFRVVPPATGIVHQVNLEYLATVVTAREAGGVSVAYPDTLVGTDSHTTMINGLGVLGWGVGGIEAEAVMLGQPYYMLAPAVIGVRLSGRAREGVTATDLVLTITQMLRKHGVVDKFVEFFGPGLSAMSLPDRATIANMAPEFGATCAFFPVDDETLRYLRLTGRPEPAALAEAYCKEQGLFRTDQTPDPEFTEVLRLDLGDVEPSLAGPKRPQDRVALAAVKSGFGRALVAPVQEGGYAVPAEQAQRSATAVLERETVTLSHGSVAIAAITSCTNTSNPSVMLAAGLLARKAVERGLTVKPFVKTSMAPGSKVVTDYLARAGLLEPLERLGFAVVGYGCTTCIGNSGPLAESVGQAVAENGLVVAAVLSGNRNFEGRVNPHTRANYLASPPLVVAYALAGRVDLDLTREPLGTDAQGRPVMLSELWPRQDEITAAVAAHVRPEMFEKSYADVFKGNEAWNGIAVPQGGLFRWDPASTYIQEPPFFVGLSRTPGAPAPVRGARVLVMVGDSVTTDHISPAGDIALDSPAGRYLRERGVPRAEFNSYGSRRGNHEVMMRGTFANIRLKNLLVPGVEGNVTVHHPSGERMSVYDAALRYREAGTALIVLAGKEYGTGSSRDWAAKGALLLGVRAVIAESIERIHRSNLVGMGVLPLVYAEGQSARSLGLDGTETYDVEGVEALDAPRRVLQVRARRADGRDVSFQALARLDAAVEVEYFRSAGILPAVLRRLLAS